MKNELDKAIAIVSTPVSRVSGFFYPEYNVLVTSLQGVDYFRQVVVRSQLAPPFTAIVKAFDPYYKLAFYTFPLFLNLNFYQYKTYLPDIGQHLTVLLPKVDSSVKRLTAVVLKYNQQHNIPFFNVKTDFSNQVALGALVIDIDDNPVGVVVNVLPDSYEVLPLKNVIESILDFVDYQEYAFRCPFCGRILTQPYVNLGRCGYCGQLLPEELYETRIETPEKYETRVDFILENLGFQPNLARLDKNFWEVYSEGFQFFFFYDQNNHSVVAYTVLTQLKERFSSELKAKLWEFLLKKNDQLDFLSISISQNQVMLSTIYVTLEHAATSHTIDVFKKLFEAAPMLKKQIDDLLA